MALDLRSWISSTIGIVVSATIAVIAFVYFAVNVATRSHTDDMVEVSASVLSGVEVYRNSFGVPHIVASSIEDVVSGQGFVHAQDRLWQMDIWRRFAQGRLSEVLGSRTVDVDVFMRALQIRAIAERQYAALDDTTRRLLDAYAAGVNAFIDTHREQLSFEFDALDYHPALWTAIDCLIVGRVVAFELSLAFWNDIAYAEILQQRGYDALLDYIPRAPGPPYVLDSTSATPVAWICRAPADTSSGSGLAIQRVAHGLQQIRSVMGWNGSSVGSNCWAVGRSDTTSAILANDPHLSVSMPTKWYQVHLTGGPLNVVGIGIPGVPFVLSGRNDDLAWGVTNVMVDDVDYMIERVDQSNSNYYLDADGTRKKFRFVLDTVKIADRPDTLMYLRFTERGCVISDVHPYADPSWLFRMDRRPATDLMKSNCLTFRWTAQAPSNEIGALYRINRASSIGEVSNALDDWFSPAFNFHVAEKDGSVGTIVAGVVPNRVRMDPLLPTPISVAGADWNGYIHLKALGTIQREPPARVSSANNRTVPGQTPFVSTYYQPSSRIERINELADVYTDMSVRDAQVMQMDQVSPFARSLVERLLPYLEKGADQYGSVGRSALRALQNWDGAMTPVDTAATIYAVMLQRLMWNTFEDELGSQLYYDWVFLTSNPINRLQDLLSLPRHRLFDDRRTPDDQENLPWIAVRSFIEAVRELHDRFDGDPVSQWTYGRLRTVTLPHLMGDHPLLKPVMNVGPFEIGGSSTTLLNTEWRVFRPYETAIYPSARLISDLSDSVQYAVLPGGISGQPLDAHYSDQVQLWLKGGYIRIPCSREPDVTFRLAARLTPVN